MKLARMRMNDGEEKGGKEFSGIQGLALMMMVMRITMVMMNSRMWIMMRMMMTMRG